MRDRYERQLALLRNELTGMGAMCVSAISLAIQALVEDDDALAARVYEVDHGIDKKERDIESICLKLLLQQQPVASDLREVSAALKMISDMERIGDQASDIAEITEQILGRKSATEDDLKRMAEESVKMVTESVDAFCRRDLTLAREVIAYDDVVDNWFTRLRGEVVTLLSSEDGEYAVDLLMIAKYLERIADHATNIAEWVEYALTGARSKDGRIMENEFYTRPEE